MNPLCLPCEHRKAIVAGTVVVGAGIALAAGGIAFGLLVGLTGAAAYFLFSQKKTDKGTGAVAEKKKEKSHPVALNPKEKISCKMTEKEVCLDAALQMQYISLCAVVVVFSWSLSS